MNTEITLKIPAEEFIALALDVLIKVEKKDE